MKIDRKNLFYQFKSYENKVRTLFVLQPCDADVSFLSLFKARFRAKLVRLLVRT